MNNLDDQLDLRYHRGLQVKPDAYYRCPTSESLDGALRNEIQKSASSIIPVEVVTEFVFASAATVTIPVSQQGNLDELGFLPADIPQSITIENALCRDIQGRARLKTQRAIARSFIDVLRGIDGFKYSERQACNKDGGDGARFKYVCSSSRQNRDRKSNEKREDRVENGAVDLDQSPARRKRGSLPTYDCGGAIHIKFSIKRAAVNIVYKHNPIHRDSDTRPAERKSRSPLPSAEGIENAQDVAPGLSDGATLLKRKRTKKTDVGDTNGYDNGDLDASTSTEAVKASTAKRSKKSNTADSPKTSLNSNTKRKHHKSSTESRPSKQTLARGLSPPPRSPKPIQGRACVRCKQKKIKCDHAEPTCNQCQRGLWTCRYELLVKDQKTRSKNGCLPCRQRKIKCSEEKPACAHCLKINDDCAYGEVR